MMLQVNLKGREVIPEVPPYDEFVPGDLVLSKQGKMYLVVAANDNTLYYFTLDYHGNILRPGQVIHGYAVCNWRKIGRVDITIGEPEWY